MKSRKIVISRPTLTTLILRAVRGGAAAAGNAETANVANNPLYVGSANAGVNPLHQS